MKSVAVCFLAIKKHSLQKDQVLKDKPDESVEVFQTVRCKSIKVEGINEMGTTFHCFRLGWVLLGVRNANAQSPQNLPGFFPVKNKIITYV